MAGTTTILGLPYPNNADVPNVAGDIAALANALEAKIGMVKIAEGALAAGAFAFDAIPGTYKALKLIGAFRGTSNVTVGLRLNDDATAQYDYTIHEIDETGTHTVTATSTQTSIPICFAPSANSLGIAEILIADYADAGVQKMVQGTASWEAAGVLLQRSVVGKYIDTEAITDVTVIPSSSTLAALSHCALYGLR